MVTNSGTTNQVTKPSVSVSAPLRTCTPAVVTVMSTSRQTKTGGKARQGRKPAVDPSETESATRSPKRGQNAKYDSTMALDTVNGATVDISPKKPSQEAKERVREKLQIHELQSELTKKRAECDILREGGRQIQEELNYQKEVLSQQTNDTIRRLEQETSELSAVVEEQKKREGEMERQVQGLEKALRDKSEELKVAQEKQKTLEEEKKQIEEEREELRKSNRRQVEEISAAKAEIVKIAQRAEDAEKKAAQELQTRQEVEAQNEEVVNERDAAMFERDEAQTSCKTLEDHIEKREQEKRDRPSEATQTDLRSCVSCLSKTEYKGDITVMESCSLLPYFIHGDRRNLIVPLRRKQSQTQIQSQANVIDLNDYKADNPNPNVNEHRDMSSNGQRPAPPSKLKRRSSSNQSGTKLPSLLKSKKGVAGREVATSDPFLTGKFANAISADPSSQQPLLQQGGQILVLDQQGDGYYVLVDGNSEDGEDCVLPCFAFRAILGDLGAKGVSGRSITAGFPPGPAWLSVFAASAAVMSKSAVTKRGKPGSKARQVKKPVGDQPETDSVGELPTKSEAPKKAQNAKYDSTLSLNTMNGATVDIPPKKPSQEAKERVREKLQIHDLQSELTKKRAECDILREGGRQIQEELNFQKAVLSVKTDETIRQLTEDNHELFAVVEEQRAREGEMELRVEDLEKALQEAQEQQKSLEEEKKHVEDEKMELQQLLKEAEEKQKSLEEEKKQVEEEREELRKSNRRQVEEISAAKAEVIETARRAEDAEKRAAQELQTRQEVEAQNEEVVKERDDAVLERDDAQTSCKTLEEHIERTEQEKLDRPSVAAQTDLRSCVSCTSKTEHKGDITVMESCSLLPYFIHGDRRNLIVPLRRKQSQSKVIDLNDYDVDSPYDHMPSTAGSRRPYDHMPSTASSRRPTPPNKPQKRPSNQGTKLPSLLKSKKGVAGRQVELTDPLLTGKFNIAISAESGSAQPKIQQGGQILVLDQQGDDYYVLVDGNSEAVAVNGKQENGHI
ncbi:myosin-14-like [Branchiostoma lanceolatum]|uniref:myosin-14-like n=1 Tax=Branchiostoma lanceolatum TaxID=7740 RepID=UPI003453159F